MPRKEKDVICKGCGCGFKTTHKVFHSDECKKEYTEKNLPNVKYITYKKGAEIRNIEFNLSFEEFMLLWQKPCEYCGDEIKTIGIDRVDNHIGYIVDNTVPCCAICNLMKSTYGQYFFISHCKKITEFNLSKIQISK